MKNFVQPGNTVTLTVPADCASGDGVLVGSIFGIAAADYGEGDEGSFDLVGVYDLPKAAVAITQGATVYWDATAKNVTTTATDNTKIGAAITPVTADAGTARVRLNGAV